MSQTESEMREHPIKMNQLNQRANNIYFNEIMKQNEPTSWTLQWRVIEKWENRGEENADAAMAENARSTVQTRRRREERCAVAVRDGVGRRCGAPPLCCES